MKKTNSFQERVYEQTFLLKYRSVLDAWTSISGCGGFLRRKTFVSRWERFSSTKLCKAILGDDGSRCRASSLRQHISYTADTYTCSARCFALWKRNGSVLLGSGRSDLERAQVYWDEFWVDRVGCCIDTLTKGVAFCRRTKNCVEGMSTYRGVPMVRIPGGNFASVTKETPCSCLNFLEKFPVERK